MKKFSPKEIKHLAKLCRLSLSPQEEKRLAKELEEIVKFVSQLQELKLNLPPFLFEEKTVALREDKKAWRKKPEQYLQLAPQRERRFFKVPRVR